MGVFDGLCVIVGTLLLGTLVGLVGDAEGMLVGSALGARVGARVGESDNEGVSNNDVAFTSVCCCIAVADKGADVTV